MKFVVAAWFEKITAAVMAFIMSLSLFGGEAPPTPVERPEANTVTAYSAEKSDYQLNVDVGEEIHDISDLLFGVFFEDINFAADGGLYAEKVINRSFEYFEQAAGDNLHGWSAVGSVSYRVVDDSATALNANNTNYLVIENTSADSAGIANCGFLDGMNCVAGESYDFSVYAKGVSGYDGKIYVRLVADGAVAASGEIPSVTDEWQKYSLSLDCTVTVSSNVYLQVAIDNGSVALDMVSLFPENTFLGRENGLRADLAQMVADLEPKFLRFPGGCIIEGWDYESAYNWKDSLGVGADGNPLEFNGKYGDVATRSYGVNIWTDTVATEDVNPCFMSYGLGFFEYFQFAEDIGAIGVPVINCGLYCQMRGRGPAEDERFEQYLQDMLDLVEFCRGDENTTWGRVRCDLGHPEPFELKYICIGNENEGEVYFERYQAFLELFLEVKAENPELYEGIELIYSSGASDATHSANYLKSYVFADGWLSENPDYTVTDFAGATDQHYYNTPEWFLKHTDYYDEKNYTRDESLMADSPHGGGIDVFLGEYAAKSNNLHAALAEAAYMTGLERNGDIVRMAAYAPLFGNLTATHWAPDLIWFNNHQVTGSINYYMQKIFSINAGTKLLKSKLDGASVEQPDLNGMVGVGTWYTSVKFDNVLVTDNSNGRFLGRDSFNTELSYWWGWNEATDDGDWHVDDHALVNRSTWMEYSNTGTVAYFGDADWTNYTYTVDCTKLAGDEGFLIAFGVNDIDNNYFWNIGGWGNTLSCVQRIENGAKSGQIPGTVTDFTVETGKTYQVKIVVDGTVVTGYIDGVEQFSFNTASESEAECYHVVSTDESGDTIIKLVNVTGESRTVAVDIAGAESVSESAKVYQVAGDSLGNDNILGAVEDCTMKEFTVSGISTKFNYTVPMYSVTVIRISK